MKFSRFLSMLIGVVVMGLGVAVIINTPQSEAAFGTSPPWVKNDHLLPGTTFEQVINLSRNDDSQDMQVNIRLDGDKEIEKWLKIDNENNLVMKKGQTVLPMNVTVKVPKNAALKDYKGGIFVTLESVTSGTQQGGNVAIKLGAHILVELSVIGDKVINYRIKSVTLDTLGQGDPFHLNVEVENMGNTEISELTGQVDIYDKQEKQVLKSVTFGKLADYVSPDEVKKTQVNFPDIILDPGEYWVKINIMKDGKSIYQNKLYQKVESKVIPVITPEDVGVKKPSIPKATEETAAPVETKPVETAVQQPIIIHEAAPVRNQRRATIQRYLADHKFNNE